MKQESYSKQQDTRGEMPAALWKNYAYTLVMPYSANLICVTHKGGRGKIYHTHPRLSFYSAFITNAASELYKAGMTKKLLLCGETTFGNSNTTTSDLMREALIRSGVASEDIITVPGKKLDNTAKQIKAAAAFQKKVSRSEPMLVLDWAFHDERIRHHMQGLQLHATTVSAESVHHYLHPKFHRGFMESILPKKFAEREWKPRLLSRIDSHGYIPRFLLPFRGASVTDITRDCTNSMVLPNGSRKSALDLLDTTGRRRLRMLTKRT